MTTAITGAAATAIMVIVGIMTVPPTVAIPVEARASDSVSGPDVGKSRM
jgi:hypothetical protein